MRIEPAGCAIRSEGRQRRGIVGKYPAEGSACIALATEPDVHNAVLDEQARALVVKVRVEERWLTIRAGIAARDDPAAGRIVAQRLHLVRGMLEVLRGAIARL